MNELISFGSESEGFYDRCMFFTDKPKIHVAADQRRAYNDLESAYGAAFFWNVFSTVFSIHHGTSIQYTLSDDAQVYNDSLLDEHVVDFNSQYNTASGELLTVGYHWF